MFPSAWDKKRRHAGSFSSLLPGAFSDSTLSRSPGASKAHRREVVSTKGNRNSEIERTGFGRLPERSLLRGCDDLQDLRAVFFHQLRADSGYLQEFRVVGGEVICDRLHCFIAENSESGDGTLFCLGEPPGFQGSSGRIRGRLGRTAARDRFLSIRKPKRGISIRQRSKPKSPRAQKASSPFISTDIRRR